MSIKDIIGLHVDLKEKGTNYIGLCQFHQEKTPSFFVDTEKQTFKCFGCGKQGDEKDFLLLIMKRLSDNGQ